MPKYRLLSTEELLDFEKEFIDYLIVNGIDAREWESMQSSNKEDCNRIVELFSDVVFEKILRQTRFLINVKWPYLFSFHYKEKGADLIIAQFDEGVQQERSDTWNLQLIKNLGPPRSIQSQQKTYTLPREMELFQMMNSGCVADDGQVFEYMQLLFERTTE